MFAFQALFSCFSALKDGKKRSAFNKVVLSVPCAFKTFWFSTSNVPVKRSVPTLKIKSFKVYFSDVPVKRADKLKFPSKF